MSRTIANLTLGLNAQARAVLAMLADMSLHELSPYNEATMEYDAETNTYAWYNGRERGVILEIRATLTAHKALLITFGECRSSDHIFVDSWETDEFFLNPPTVKDFPDAAYRARTTFPPGRIDEVVDSIRDKIGAFIAAQVAVPQPPVRVLPELGEEAAPVISLRTARKRSR